MIKRIMSTSDMFAITALLILMTHSAIEIEARPQHHQQQQQQHQQQAEEVFYPEPSVQISAQKVIEIFPRTLRLENITAYTQEILAKIDQVNRQHGYVKPETPKRSQFVPGYFTHHYNYKERVLKGFDVPSHREASPSQLEQDIYNALRPKGSGDPLGEDDQDNQDNQDNQEKMQDFQAQMSVDHVKHIVQNYPIHDYHRYQGIQGLQGYQQGNQGYQGYPGYNQPGYVQYDPYYKQYVQFLPDVNPYMNQNPFYGYMPPAPEYLQNLNLAPVPTMSTMPGMAGMSPIQEVYIPMFYNPYIPGSPAASPVTEKPEEKCSSTEDLKRAPKILDKSKALSRESKDAAMLDQTTQSTTGTSTKSHRVIIENKPMEIPSTNEDNRTLIKQLVERHKENRLNADNRRNTKRPSIFRPHTWFNNQPMHKNKTESVSVESTEDEDVSEGESIALEGALDSNKGIFGNRPFGQNRRKLFSKDNTGSGIFIHKLKVRKGGVAIAGPGGIATAGSGGTAIVGPNGYAFTHPDSLAIAGSGTKVIAVDPKVNLSDLVSNVNNNGTLKSLNATLATIGARMGKLVATGPVIYYNKG